MTYQIAKSRVEALGYDFAAEVAKYIKALEDHRTSGDAAPHSSAEVEAAVKRVQYPVDQQKPDDFVADYEIIDDTPPPPTLAERKAKARVDLLRDEQAAVDAVIAPEKIRLAQMKYARAVAIQEEKRTPADKKAIDDWNWTVKRISDVQFEYATKEAAIADMT